MNAKHTVLSSLGLMATVALLAACGGSNSSPEYPQSSGYGQAAGQPAVDAPADISTGDDDGADGSARSFPEPSAPPPAGAPGATAKGGRFSPDRDAENEERSADDPFALQRKRSRPGLATQWGERRVSRVSSAPFVRADRTSPFALSKVFYNDPAGIQAMSDQLGGLRRHNRRFAVGSGHVEIGVRDGSGRFLTGFAANGNNYVSGIAGRRYTIVVKNHSPGRIEALLSVDGLDVIDGKDASFSKRGYLIDPHGDLEIDGFRTSNSEVAAFRFGSVASSYAAKKHGKTRNVGVIGVALFHERGDSPRFWGTPRSHQDVSNRHSADPFPNRFAQPAH